MTALLVCLFGGVGAVCRFLTDLAVMRRFHTSLPIATLSINVVGSFLIGLLAGLMPSASVYAVAATGFCGGFTTFSTAMVEVVRLGRSRRMPAAVALGFGMLVLAVVAAAAGNALGQLL